MQTPGLLFLRLLVLTLLAILLIPAGAHLFEMPAKMAMQPADYMIVQRIYAGWALFGIPIALAIVVLIIHAVAARHNRTAFWLTLLALAAVIVSQIIFWSYTYPMNALTENWTVMPSNLETARRQWEYSHAINALVTFIAFISGTLAVLAERRRRYSNAPPHGQL